MARYMLMLLDTPADYAALTPQQMQEVVAEYGQLVARMSQESKLAGGEKLADEGGKRLKGKGHARGC